MRIPVQQLGIQKFVPVNKRTREKGVSDAKQGVLSKSDLEKIGELLFLLKAKLGSDLAIIKTGKTADSIREDIREADRLAKLTLMEAYNDKS